MTVTSGNLESSAHILRGPWFMSTRMVGGSHAQAEALNYEAFTTTLT
jgi:hypothetical protein